MVPACGAGAVHGMDLAALRRGRSLHPAGDVGGDGAHVGLGRPSQLMADGPHGACRRRMIGIQAGAKEGVDALRRPGAGGGAVAIERRCIPAL